MISKSNYTIYLGALISQICSLVTSYLILWKLSPDVYGEFSYFVSIASIIASISTLKFEQSIAISKDSRDVNSKFFLTLYTGILLFIILILLFQLFTNHFDGIGLLLSFLLAIGIIINASIQQYYLYVEKHKFNALLSVSIPFLNLSLIFVFLQISKGLIYSYVISYFIVTVLFFIYCLKKSSLEVVGYKMVKAAFIENINYPKFVLPASFATIALTYLHPICLERIYSMSDVGLFSIANRFLLLPSIIFGAVVAGLFRARISKFYYQNDLLSVKKEYVKVLKYMFVVAFLSFPILVFVLDNLDEFIVIKNWKDLGKYSYYLVGYGIAQFLIVPILNIPLVLNKHKLLLGINIIQLILLLFCYLIAWQFKINIFIFLFFMSSSSIVYVFILSWFLYKVIK